MSDFNLRAAVRTVLDTTDLTSPADVAAKVAESVPAKELRSALALALEIVVRVQFSRDRAWNPAPVAANRSAKVAAFRKDAEAWRKRLHNRFPVGGGQDRLMADLSYDNFLYIADLRRSHAAATLAAADRADQCAKAMRSAGVDRFGDLPDDVLRDLLSDEEDSQ